MKTVLVENYLKGLKSPPRTPEGVVTLIERLCGEMGFSPLPEDEIKRIAALVCQPPNKTTKAKKGAKRGGSTPENS